jgi:hypothetical protein
VPSPAVLVRDLVVRYGTREAVAGLSFEAAAGRVTALVGPNGAGKSSTVEVCVGLRPATAGSVEILGAAAGTASASALRSRVGVMLQDGGLYSTARPLELVRYIASLYPPPARRSGGCPAVSSSASSARSRWSAGPSWSSWTSRRRDWTRSPVARSTTSCAAWSGTARRSS